MNDTTTAAETAANPHGAGPDQRTNLSEGLSAAYAALRERIERLEADVRRLQSQLANRA